MMVDDSPYTSGNRHILEEDKYYQVSMQMAILPDISYSIQDFNTNLWLFDEKDRVIGKQSFQMPGRKMLDS